MKTFTALMSISLAALAIASPLGDRAVFQRHNGTPYPNARRYILQSRVDAPPACAALSLSNVTTSPDLTNTTIPLSNATTSPDLSNVTAPFANTTSTVDNATSTNNSTTDVNTPLNVDNTTSVDNSTSTGNSTTLSRRSRRHWRRIEQDDLPDVAQSWQDLCLVSGGDILTNDPCVKLAGLDGLSALLADADPCAQQDNADAMIAFAKSAGVNNTDELITNAIVYRQHPRNAMNILGVVPSTVYCQKAPQSPELVGVVNAQLDGVEHGLFGSPNIPLMPFGAPGTCPFGQEPDVTTCTCVDTATTEGPTSTDASSITDTGATNTSVTVITAASGTVSSTGTEATIIASTTSVASSEVADFTSSAASATLSLGSQSAAPTQSSVTTTAPVTFSAVAAPSTTSGPNIQPNDISGNVNDING